MRDMSLLHRTASGRTPATLLSLAAAALVALVTGRAALAGAAPATRPMNVVVILADDLGAPELGCYGNTAHATPNLDRLATEGMRFETAWATPLCSPTRVMLMTGQFASRTGWYALIGRPFSPRPDTPLYDLNARTTFADVLKSRGYATGLAGKWQLPGEGDNLVTGCGFDEYLIWAYKENLPPGTRYTSGWQNEKRQVTSRYWHPSLVSNGKYVPTKPDDYGPDKFCDFMIDFVRRHKEGPFVAYWPMALTHSPHDPTPDPARPGQKLPRGLKSNVEYMDHLVGRFLRALDDQGLRDSTLVLFAGDNGTEGAGKSTTTEMGARVPLIVRRPGLVPPGTVSRELASLADVLPTLAELAGATLPADHPLDGKSLVPTLRDPATKHRDILVSYLRDQEMARDTRWLLEGNGDLFDCGDRRAGTGYRLIPKSSNDPEATAARRRLQAALDAVPGPRPEQQLRPRPVPGAAKPPDAAAE
jgi:arylsulfatase A